MFFFFFNAHSNITTHEKGKGCENTPDYTVNMSAQLCFLYTYHAVIFSFEMTLYI